MTQRTPPIAGTERTIRLAALPTAPGIARRFAVHALSGWQLPADHIDTVELLTSELVTNAAQAAGRTDGPPFHQPTERVATIHLWVRHQPPHTTIAVWDPNPNPPARTNSSALTENGRGLVLVSTLAKVWGHYPTATGKLVWAAIMMEGR